MKWYQKLAVAYMAAVVIGLLLAACVGLYEKVGWKGPAFVAGILLLVLSFFALMGVDE
jgi:hypothetical protein